MAERSDEEEERGFVVIDRRGRSDEQEHGPDAPEPEAREPDAAAPGAREARPAGASAEASGPAKVDFSMLVLSLSHSAFFHLGLVEDPVTQQSGPVDKALARTDIDMLEILQEKTQGNLTSEEEKLLQSLLYDLRLRFVQAG